MHTRRTATALRVVAVVLAATGCASRQPVEPSPRAKAAKALFDEHCKKAGVFIHRTVKDVDGILVMKHRPDAINYGNQYQMDDPYGRDFGGDDYLESFLRGSYQANTKGLLPPGSPPRLGYQYVEAVDPADGRRYRYTGEVRDHLVTPNRAFASVTEPFIARGFVMYKALAAGTSPRYGVTYDDISTRDDREHWIAGSSLRVIDTQSGEVLAERIGYMWEPQQGNDSGGRAPWLWAANHACPSFDRIPGGVPDRNGSSRQARQTQDFVEAVLMPKQ